MSLGLVVGQWIFQHRTCTVVGGQGNIVWDYYGKSTILHSRVTGRTETLDFGDLERNRLFLDELEHFFTAVNGEVSPVVNLRSGYEGL